MVYLVAGFARVIILYVKTGYKNTPVEAEPKALQWLQSRGYGTADLDFLLQKGIDRLDYLFLPGSMPTGKQESLTFFENGHQVTRIVDGADPLVAAVRVAEVVRTQTPWPMNDASILQKVQINYLTPEGIKKISNENYATGR